MITAEAGLVMIVLLFFLLLAPALWRIWITEQYTRTEAHRSTFYKTTTLFDTRDLVVESVFKSEDFPRPAFPWSLNSLDPKPASGDTDKTELGLYVDFPNKSVEGWKRRHVQYSSGWKGFRGEMDIDRYGAVIRPPWTREGWPFIPTQDTELHTEGAQLAGELFKKLADFLVKNLMDYSQTKNDQFNTPDKESGKTEKDKRFSDDKRKEIEEKIGKVIKTIQDFITGLPARAGLPAAGEAVAIRSWYDKSREKTLTSKVVEGLRLEAPGEKSELPKTKKKAKKKDDDEAGDNDKAIKDALKDLAGEVEKAAKENSCWCPDPNEPEKLLNLAGLFKKFSWKDLKNFYHEIRDLWNDMSKYGKDDGNDNKDAPDLPDPAPATDDKST